MQIGEWILQRWPATPRSQPRGCPPGCRCRTTWPWNPCASKQTPRVKAYLSQSGTACTDMFNIFQSKIFIITLIKKSISKFSNRIESIMKHREDSGQKQPHLHGLFVMHEPRKTCKNNSVNCVKHSVKLFVTLFVQLFVKVLKLN